MLRGCHRFCRVYYKLALGSDRNPLSSLPPPCSLLPHSSWEIRRETEKKRERNGKETVETEKKCWWKKRQRHSKETEKKCNQNGQETFWNTWKRNAHSMFVDTNNMWSLHIFLCVFCYVASIASCLFLVVETDCPVPWVFPPVFPS